MRTIKFRGKRLDNGEWVYGWVGVAVDGQAARIWEPSQLFTKGVPIDPDTIGQFTGLVDQNLVPIYEGDVVYLAGYGDYGVVFPFLELYEAAMEHDIGEIRRRPQCMD